MNVFFQASNKSWPIYVVPEAESGGGRKWRERVFFFSVF
jgi:hypothetical protein